MIVSREALEDERRHLADLLEALHRTAYFLHSSARNEAAGRLLQTCDQTLAVCPTSDDFRAEFMQVLADVRP